MAHRFNLSNQRLLFLDSLLCFCFGLAVRFFLNAKTSFSFLNTLELFIFRVVEGFDPGAERLFLLVALARIRFDLTPNRFQFGHPSRLLLIVALRFCLSVQMRFFLRTKTSLGFLDALELFRLRFSECFNLSVKCLLALRALLGS